MMPWFQDETIMLGEGTPLINSIYAGAPSGSGSAVFISDPSRNGELSHDGRPDYVELSSEARERLEPGGQTQADINIGRGEPDEEQVVDVSLIGQETQTRNDEFVETSKSFSEIVIEFQESVDDENRIPPSIFKQMQKLLEAALQPQEQEHELDKVA